jgi:hypothetical protein
MKKKYRKILFTSFLVLFFIVAPILVFYTQGYRIDFENKKIIQTGGLFFDIEPKQASIYLDNQFIKKTDFFFSSVLIENLLPKKYNIQIKKEDYISWEKNLSVTEKQVTEAGNIILFPKDFNFQPITNKIQDFWISPTEEKIIWKEESNNKWELKLYDLNKELQSYLIGETDISRKNVDFIDLQFSNDGKKIYLEVINSEQLQNYSLDINDGLSSLNKEAEPEINEDIIAFTTFNGSNYYLSKNGYLYKTNDDLTKEIKNKDKINELAFSIQKETPYQLYVFPNFIFLKEDNVTYQFNNKDKKFEKISENIKDFKLSENEKYVSYFSDKEIWIISLEKNKVYEKNQKVFLLRFSEPIQNIFWINSSYLVFNTNNHIKITEVDNRDKLNIIDLGNFQSPKIFWSPSTQRLYYLEGKILKQSKELLR